MCTHRGKAMWRHDKKAAVCQPKREASAETKPASILTFDFQLPELWENKCLLFKLPSFWYLLWQPKQTKMPQTPRSHAYHWGERSKASSGGCLARLMQGHRDGSANQTKVPFPLDWRAQSLVHVAAGPSRCPAVSPPNCLAVVGPLCCSGTAAPAMGVLGMQPQYPVADSCKSSLHADIYISFWPSTHPDPGLVLWLKSGSLHTFLWVRL